MFIWSHRVLASVEVEWGEGAGAPLWCCNAKFLLSLVERLRAGRLSKNSIRAALNASRQHKRRREARGGVNNAGGREKRNATIRTNVKANWATLTKKSRFLRWNLLFSCGGGIMKKNTNTRSVSGTKMTKEQPNSCSRVALAVRYPSGVQISFSLKFMLMVSIVFNG